MRRRADGRLQRQVKIGGQLVFLYGKSKREIDEKEQEARRKANAGISLEPNKQTLESYLNWWIEGLEATGNTAPSTVEKYRQDFTNHVYPLIGWRLFTTCNPTIFADFMRELRKRKSDRTGDYLSKRTIRNIRAALRSAFNDESAKRYHPVNPLASTKIPASLKADDNFKAVTITPNMARELLGALSSSRYGLAFRYMMTMGFREGETLAIRKQDVDLDRGLIKITGSLRRHNGKVRRGATKTEAAKATLPLPPALIGLTRAHIAAQSVVEGASEWLFPTKNGTPVEATNLIRYFRLVVARLGMPAALRVQDLRRYVGTQVAQRVDPKTAQGILRHANISTTMTYYIDDIPDEQRRALDEMDSMLDMDRVIEIPRKRIENG
jgi:integrase